MVALVDDADFEWLNQFKWYAKGPEGRYVYAVTGSEKTRMHRLILPEVVLVDHQNRDTLDNRRENLRPATRTDNGANAVRRTDNTSGFKGVYWNKEKRQWVARVGVRGKRRYLGHFDDLWQAARAYDAAAKEHFGEFACANFH